MGRRKANGTGHTIQQREQLLMEKLNYLLAIGLSDG